ncbi:hypothetical protein LTR91_011330 [Friedmanniomyces endolithicus]|uniref:Uncharacterized protein n=1 Tax=Friedmanniomyces endolithicus TaxID=329885 RepID=A0AAN6KHX0_9PEZI|nr:hypothetical protein LTR59_012786 [Friedmanniomyces endolithicus]KAK0811672.1 hypothetical protein LTR38_003596 [Friedmanniomyces endolithicus]KAK0816078.1 hypothetical protein LTR75_003651 [Friedmanniomyces endolithicus]KAK0847583.1 hypothetical protein LTS02_014420 [Friedmanniomyces endolithicus]KAK0853970.1 hypothetical protein LTR03_002598 [Friedmanniomyces endolithicus]
MLPSSQLLRPRPEAPKHRVSLYQQQTRSSHSQPDAKATTRSPASQVEAMPPNGTPRAPAAVGAGPNLTLYNPALMHPVFFTDCWRKPPFPLPVNAAFSPVAAGYVFGNGRPRADSMTKL